MFLKFKFCTAQIFETLLICDKTRILEKTGNAYQFVIMPLQYPNSIKLWNESCNVENTGNNGTSFTEVRQLKAAVFAVGTMVFKSTKANNMFLSAIAANRIVPTPEVTCLASLLANLPKVKGLQP